jgi:hypothetical protein
MPSCPHPERMRCACGAVAVGKRQVARWPAGRARGGRWLRPASATLSSGTTSRSTAPSPRSSRSPISPAGSGRQPVGSLRGVLHRLRLPARGCRPVRRPRRSQRPPSGAHVDDHRDVAGHCRRGDASRLSIHWPARPGPADPSSCGPGPVGRRGGRRRVRLRCRVRAGATARMVRRVDLGNPGSGTGRGHRHGDPARLAAAAGHAGGMGLASCVPGSVARRAGRAVPEVAA